MSFALSKAIEDIGDLDQCYTYLEKANRLRKQEVGFDTLLYAKHFDTIQKRFEGVDFPAPSNQDVKTKRPIFVLGMPRSGTSLTEQILSSHSQVFGAGELEALRQSILPFVSKNSLDNAAGPIRDAYLSALNDFGTDQPVFVDKMPSNFMWIGFIALAFPEAKIVHMRRDPRAVCWSVFKTCFQDTGPGLAFSWDLQDVISYYKLYEQMMAHWKGRLPDRVYDLSYEALTQNQEEETRKLLAHCELDWEDQCLSFHKNKRMVGTASSLQVREKIYQGSSEAWRKFEPYVGERMQNLMDALEK